jgi:hypothetical protein
VIATAVVGGLGGGAASAMAVVEIANSRTIGARGFMVEGRSNRRTKDASTAHQDVRAGT